MGKRRNILRAIGALLVLVVALVAPSASFYYAYIFPKTDLPEISKETGDTWSAPGLDPKLAAELLDEVARARLEVSSPSFSAAVAFDGTLQWAGAVGYSSIETDEPASIASRYRLGSTAKALTGALLLRLVSDGVIELDTPIDECVDGLPESYGGLTLRALASHTGGVRHYSSMPTYWPGNHPNVSGKHYASVEHGLSIFINDPLEFAPGESFRYSTYGYSLLAYALEGTSGKSFTELMTERLFETLGMTDTAFDLPGEVPERVSFYTSGDGKYSPAYPSSASYKLAGGGIVASASDVARFGLALLGTDYLDEAAKEVLFTPVTLADGSDNPQNYALGFRIDTSVRLLGEDRPTKIIHHGGRQNGAGSFFMILPEHGISVSTLTNTGTGAARGEAQSLAYALARAVIASREKHESSPSLSLTHR